MSKNSTERPNSEEVDLGQLFRLIGNAVSGFIKFVGRILNWLFLAFVWFVFFLKKNIIKIAIALILGYGLGFVKERLSAPIYQSAVIVKQNYTTGKNLYDLINYYNKLIEDQDSLALKTELNVSLQAATSISSIDIKPIIVETRMIKRYDNYLKGLDSVLASTIDYKTYCKNVDLWEHEEQQILIKSSKKMNLNPVFDKMVENINNSDYFKRENQKDINELNNREAALKQVLVKADSLQNMYKRVLEMPLDQSSGAQTSVTIEGSDQIDKTKEYELYKSEIEIRRELVGIERAKEDIENIVEIVSNKEDIAISNNNVEIFDRTFGQKMFFSMVFALLTITVMLFLDFIKFLERFKDKVV